MRLLASCLLSTTLVLNVLPCSPQAWAASAQAQTGQAQAAPAPAPVTAPDTAATGSATGSISGHVYYADTNGPARLATILLEPTSAIDGYHPPAEDTASTHVSGVKTLPNGSFLLPHVAPGTYYVYAEAPGYVSPLEGLGLSRDELSAPDRTVKERIAAAILRVVVQANLAVALDITLQRGAAVSGTVLYDDGSPAAGLNVQLLVRRKNKWVLPESGPTHQMARRMVTDDRGSYRISGLPAQEYLLKVELHLEKTSMEVNGQGMWSNSEQEQSVPVYSGNSLRQQQAKPFHIRLGEERTGEDVDVPLAKMHTITGVIAAARDGHIINGGNVELLYADDRSEAGHAELIRDDSTFALNFVGEGDYVIRAPSSSDMEYEDVPNSPSTFPTTRTESHAVHSYGASEQPLHVAGDVAGLSIVVPEQKPGEAPVGGAR